MKMVRHIPNFFTCLNLICGCVGIIEAMQGSLTNASYMIFLAGIFDFCDGYAARLLHVCSPIGKELDSLADVVTFGVLPGIILFQLINYYSSTPYAFGPKAIVLHSYFALAVPVFSALRLAKFNIDTAQSDSFIGLPTPANALVFASLPFIVAKLQLTSETNFIPAILIMLGLAMSLLLVSNIKLMALKFKTIGWQANKHKYLLLLTSAALLIFLQASAFPFIIILYVILSLFEH